MVNGKKQYGEEQIVFKDGVPQQRAEPLVSSELFYAAQAKIEERTQKQDGSRRADAPAMLTGVAYCGTCGFKLYRNVRTDRRDVYRCNSSQKGKTCGNGTMICELLDSEVSDYVVSRIGDVPHVRREYVPGSDNGATIAQIDAQLMTYVNSLGSFTVGTAPYDAMMTRVEGLNAKRTELESEETVEAGWRYVPTGQTFAEFWEGQTVEQRNDYLRDNGVSVTMTRVRGDQPTWTVKLGNIPALLSSVNPEYEARVMDTVAYDFLGSDDPELAREFLRR